MITSLVDVRIEGMCEFQHSSRNQHLSSSQSTLTGVHSHMQASEQPELLTARIDLLHAYYLPRIISLALTIGVISAEPMPSTKPSLEVLMRALFPRVLCLTLNVQIHLQQHCSRCILS
jgi:hypothetical protein